MAHGISENENENGPGSKTPWNKLLQRVLPWAMSVFASTTETASNEPDVMESLSAGTVPKGIGLKQVYTVYVDRLQR